MDEETYKALLDRLQALEDKVNATDKKVEDVSSFNRALLNTKEPVSKTASSDERKKYLAQKLKEGIK